MSASLKEVVKEHHKISSNLNWNLIHGDIVKFLANDPDEEVVIFEKNFTEFEDIAVPAAADAAAAPMADIKRNLDSKLQLMHIILYRRENTAIDVSAKESRDKPNGTKSIALSLRFGDRTKPKVKKFPINREPLPFDITHLNSLEREIFSLLNTHSVFLDYAPSEKVHTTLLNLRQTEYLESSYSFGLTSDKLSAYLFEQLFTILRKINLIGNDDITFLQSLVKPRDLSHEEITLNAKMKAAIHLGKFQHAVSFANQLHSLSQKKAIARSTQCSTTEQNKRELHVIIDDCDAAFKLGEYLESVSPQHAVSAFKIIINNVSNPKSDFSFDSPYAKQAIAKIANISLVLIAFGKNEDERRRLRKEAMKAALLLCTNSDSDQNATFRTLTRLIETQTGFESYSSELFQNLKINIQTDLDLFNTLFEILSTLADKIYEYKKSSNVDVKSQHENKETLKAALTLPADPNLDHNAAFRALMERIETQTGFEGNSNELFKNLKINIRTHMDIFNILFEILSILADKIYEYKKSSNVDVKSQHDAAQAVDRKDQYDIAAPHSAAGASAAAAAGAAAGQGNNSGPAGLTYLMSTRVARSLVEGDDDLSPPAIADPAIAPTGTSKK